MSENIIFSCIIPAKDPNDPKLKDLISSIKTQDFPQDQIEILVITEGDSEQAKAIGIRRAKGQICAMFCADNYLVNSEVFKYIKLVFDVNKLITGMYFKYYALKKDDNLLNRYFSLIGNNDPIAFYLGKCDKKPYYDYDKDEYFSYFIFQDRVPSLGDNGFFYWKDSIQQADLDHYYPMDCAEDLRRKGKNRYFRSNYSCIWHRTSENLISFLIKRYKYARDLFSDRQDRRWKIIDGHEDIWKLFLFVLFTLTIIEPLWVSIRGYRRVRDLAWFYHPVVCFGFLITYTILALRNLFKYGRLFQVKCLLPA